MTELTASTPAAQPVTSTEDRLILFFDGTCLFCNRWVRFLLERDGSGRLRVARLGGAFARRTLPGPTTDGPDARTVVLLDGEACLERSEAILRVVAELRWPWRLFALARWVPRGLRNRAYDWVARNRYRWTGNAESCALPSPALRARFIDD